MSVIFNNFAELADQIYQGCGDGVNKTAQDIVDGYSGSAPRDSGAMADSGYVVSTTQNTYGSVAEPVHKGSYLLPEVATPSDDVTALAAVAMNYAVYPELGTRFQPAQPAFYPAVANAGNQLASNIVDAISARIGGP